MQTRQRQIVSKCDGGLISIIVTWIRYSGHSCMLFTGECRGIPRRTIPRTFFSFENLSPDFSGVDCLVLWSNVISKSVCLFVRLSVHSDRLTASVTTEIPSTFFDLWVDQISPLLPRTMSALTRGITWATHFEEQEAFEKCWAHSPQRAAARCITIQRVSLCRVARRLRIDVHYDDDDDDNDNAWQRGPLWPHGMGPMTLQIIIGLQWMPFQDLFHTFFNWRSVQVCYCSAVSVSSPNLSIS